MKQILLSLLIVTSLVLPACGTQSNHSTPASELDLSDKSQKNKEVNEETVESNENITQPPGSINEILKEKKYDISDDDFIDFSIYDDGSLNALIYINDTEKMSLAFAYFQTTFTKLSGFNVSVGGFCENGSIIWTKTESGEMINSVDSSGNTSATLPDWVHNTLDDPTLTEDEQTEFIEMLIGYSSDFISDK